MPNHSDFPRMTTRCEVRDRLLSRFGDWESHDGRGVPVHLIGRYVMLAGPGVSELHQCVSPVIEVTDAYAASEAAVVWTWGNGKGVGCVECYRVVRRDALTFDPETLHELDMARGWRPQAALLIGLDGEQVW